MIDPDQIPQFTGNVDQLESDIGDLKGDGSAIAGTGAHVNSSFQGLSAYYDAPEAEQLFATTKPVATAGTTFENDLSRVTGALSAYATEIRPIARKLADLKEQAETFVHSVAHDKNWQYDGDKVKQDNHLRSEVDAAVAAFWDAERRCANAIEAVFGGTRFVANDGSNKADMYGYSAKQLDGAKGLPWGDPVEQKYHWYNVGHWTWSFIKGFCVDGLWGTLKGIGGLVGFEGWHTLVNSWKGLGELGIGLASYQFLPPMGPDEKYLPAWLRDSRRTTVAAGKAMIAWDEWSKDPGRAAGGVVFNVLTVVAGGGEADGAEAAGDAGKASMAARTMGALGKAGRFVDPMTYIGKGTGMAFGGLAKIPRVSIALDKLSDVKTVSVTRLGGHLDNLRTHLPGFAGSDVPVVAGEVPHVSTVVPLDTAAHNPAEGAHVPAGDMHPTTGDITAGPDGTIHFPDGSRLTKDGNYHLADGTTTTIPSEDLAHTPHLRTEAPTHELVGTHAGNGTLVHAGDFGDRVPGHVADNAAHAELGTHPAGHTPAIGHPAEPVGHTGHATTHAGEDRGHADGGGHTGSGDHGGPAGGGRGPGGHDNPPPSHDGGGGNHGSDGAHEPLERALGKHPEARTADERQAVMRHQVHRANTDHSYFQEHYKSNGTRKDLSHQDSQTGTTPPQLVKPGDSGAWVSVHDAPEPLPPKYHDTTPLVRGRESLPNHSVQTLDKAAHDRHTAIHKDQAAETKLRDAKSAYESHRSPENLQALEHARTVHTPLHRDMGKSSENYGEAIAKHHVIPEHYAGAVQEPLHGPANGNDQFDQVWRTHDGRYVVVEAKSSVRTDLGARNLPDGVRVSQGTRAYFEDILREMEKRAAKNPAKYSSDGDLARQLSHALDEGKLDYIVVKGNENSGRYAGYSMRKFNID
ncbi:hypothetical protein ABZ832_22240 [Streptantibioticus parmotrematis]|uniref:hypothetical protein n=1 Tax=Streptantibioticus parmotrematis TaxID=2873249 RepID=UPI003411260B